jgi:hypothetical protein
VGLACLPDLTTVGLASMADPLKLGLSTFNIIINIIIFIIINITNIIINKFEKTIITIEEKP